MLDFIKVGFLVFYFYFSFNEWLLNQTDTVNTSLIPKYIDVILSLVLDKDKGV